MEQPPSSNPRFRQQMKLDRSSVPGLVGMAGDDLIQVQGSGNRVNKFVFNLFSRQEINYRQLLLGKVRNFWIGGVLQRSLYQKAKIELGLEERFDAIDLAWANSGRARELLPIGTRAIDKFDELESGRSLLILGEPGSGKTTMLLEIACELIERAEQDESLPIPVVFNLSSWSNKEAIADWLERELKAKYGASKSYARSLVRSQQLLPLLDGLDEVKLEQREICVASINQFCQRYEQTEIIVCSRVKDYDILSRRLSFQGAIFIQPLTQQQVDEYLDQAGLQLAGIKTALQGDLSLQEIVQSPLMISIAVLVYQRVSATEIPKISHKEQQKYLFDAYIRRAFGQRHVQKYERNQAMRWLIWLAKNLVRDSQSTFLIEQIQTEWLTTKAEQDFYSFKVVLCFGVFCGWIVGLCVGASGLGEWLQFLGGGFLSSLMFLANLLVEVEPVERLRWSWQRAKLGFLNWLNRVSSFGLLFGLLVIPVLFFGGLENFLRQLPGLLFFGLTIAVVGSLTNGVCICELDTKVIPNEGIWNSVRNTGFGFLIGGLCGFLVVGVYAGGSALTYHRRSIIDSLGYSFNSGLFGLCVGGVVGVLHYGGNASLRHFFLRLALLYHNRTPWNYARFLDWASDRLLLQKVGGGYIFTHRLLMEHFAELEVEDMKFNS